MDDDNVHVDDENDDDDDDEDEEDDFSPWFSLLSLLYCTL